MAVARFVLLTGLLESLNIYLCALVSSTCHPICLVFWFRVPAALKLGFITHLSCFVKLLQPGVRADDQHGLIAIWVVQM